MQRIPVDVGVAYETDPGTSSRQSLAASRVVHGQVARGHERYDWLVKAAYARVDRGEFDPSAERRKTLYKNAEQYARRAVAANPNDAEGHFQLARALGRNALTMGTRDRIKYAAEVREQALDALKVEPEACRRAARDGRCGTPRSCG